jgi:cholesterol transport system auxiliary component
MIPRPALRRAPPLMALALALSGCAGLQTLSAVTTPIDLYDLSPKSTFPPDLPRVYSQIVVEEPTSASYVNTDQIPVKVGQFKVEYFPVARWVDRAPRLVQTLMVESIENSGAVAAVGKEAIGLNSDFTLVGDLREFQAETNDDRTDPLVVHVRFNIKVVQEPQGLIVASESFPATSQAASAEMSDVVAAFDDALGRAMRDAVMWTVRTVAPIRVSPIY